MAGSKSTFAADETVDTLFNGKVSIIQKRTGYRFSIDALLLAHFATVKNARRIVDLGSGSGVVGIILAELDPNIDIVGIELQEQMVERARRSAALNAFDGRVTMMRGDVRAIATLIARESCDGAVANPPYRAASSGRINPDSEKRLARHEIVADVGDFVRAAAHAVRPGGGLAVVYPARRLIDLLDTMRRERFEPKRLRLVHSFAGAEASLALVEGVKDGRAELKVLPALTIYSAGHEYTPEISALLSGKIES
ncbi:MAG TPA: tRNA1(Val) (adenine(37)-N6)-methyltransferase [Candidatus Binatia bacterium]|jgi:tRNA1Val (adenine37-N6)-methyltransferase